MRFARRTDWELTPNRLSGLLEDFRKRGQAVVDLTESNPTRCGFHYPSGDLLSALSREQNLIYSPESKGILDARQAIADYYQSQNISLSAEQIILTASTSEAYSFVFKLLTETGDRILLPAPSYPLFDFLVDLNDLQNEYYPLIYADQWSVDSEMLSELMSDDTRAIVTVNPNNPTGSYIRREELAALNKICREHGTALISDEVFYDYAFEPSARGPSLAGNEDNLTFTLGGLSKTLGLPGMKLAWIIVNGPKNEVHEAVKRLDVIADTFLSVNTPVQNALPFWLSLRTAIQKEILERVKANRIFLQQSFSGRSPGMLLNADGGWYGIIKLADGQDEEILTETLLSSKQVYAHPGYFFNFSDEPYIILSLLPLPDIFQRGVERIIEHLRKGS